MPTYSRPMRAQRLDRLVRHKGPIASEVVDRLLEAFHMLSDAQHGSLNLGTAFGCRPEEHPYRSGRLRTTGPGQGILTAVAGSRALSHAA